MVSFLRGGNREARRNAGQAVDFNAATPADPSAQRAGGLSIIGASLKVTGNLESDGEILLHGRVDGDILGNVVTVAQGAEVAGTVRGESVKIGGKVRGRIEARNVVLGGTAHIEGDIVHETLQIETGAWVDSRSCPEFDRNAYGAGAAGPKVIDAHFEVDDPAEPVSAPRREDAQVT
jgi:cytoskeletal protein CcmA (bactofilin family)